LTHREFEIIRYLGEARAWSSTGTLLREVGLRVGPEYPFGRSSGCSAPWKKIKPDPQHPRFIHTVHGNGYC
jgi:DNA-binding response OmpR family regulator